MRADTRLLGSGHESGLLSPFGARVRAALAERPAERRVGVDPDHVQFLTAQTF